MRQRLKRAFDHFRRCVGTWRSGRRRLAARDGDRHRGRFDGSHAECSRSSIFAFRAAPIQVSYLGYPGTMGADFMDYVIADKIVLPFDQQPYYAEKIVQLPDCYLANDAGKPISPQVPSRAQEGLAEQGFVFCCFNNSYKLSPAVFDVWMRLLARVEGSVLWLSQVERSRDAKSAKRSRGARHRPRAAGIRKTRTVAGGPFGAPATGGSVRGHVALQRPCHRQRCPVGRAAGADLHGRYLCRAGCGQPAPCDRPAGARDQQSCTNTRRSRFELANDGDRLRSIRRKLAANRLTYPLFDTDRFRRHIEAAYRTMWERWQRGEGPESFAVETTLAPS